MPRKFALRKDKLLVREPYIEAWLALTPDERLRRSWRMRGRLRNPRALHDAKTFPEL